MTEHAVYLIFEDFNGDLWSLSRAHHVWLAQSPVNDVLARSVWERDSEIYDSLRGVTIFKASADRVADCYSILGTIDDHHDQYSAPTAWQSIHVRGVDLEDVDALEIAMELPGVCFGILPEAGGFVITRKAE